MRRVWPNGRLRAPREIGILDDLDPEATGGVLHYPGATILVPSFERLIGINAVWFNWY